MQETLKSPDFKRLFVEIHPHRVSAAKMQKFLAALCDCGFEIAHSVFRDTFERHVLGQTKVERISLKELTTDERVVKHRIGFELFLEKTGQG